MLTEYIKQLWYGTNATLPSITVSASMLAGVLASSTAFGVSFTDIATDPASGIDYQRTESSIDALWDPLRLGVIKFEELPLLPGATRGSPGVALLDYDNDGDLDIYVTNGPGSHNSLFSSQLKETGYLQYTDVGITSGAGAVDQDSTGVCFGDIDNDGDQDLLVLGRNEPNRLFENLGNGTFDDISAPSKLGTTVHNPSSCAMGDVDNDGLLDILIGNSYDDWSHRLPIILFGFEHLNETNQLWRNTGANEFLDISVASGVAGIQEITWAVSMVDYDQDGDLDIITADDQGGKLPADFGGADVGLIRILNNDGTGIFTDVTAASGTMEYGAWMGLSFGDLNQDGNMDLFASNIGDYTGLFFGAPVGINYGVGDWASSWFLGDASGSFSRAAAGAVVATPFGWGTGMSDYDSDGDTDIVFHGGADFAMVQDGTNPGAILQNDGAGNFTRDSLALAGSTNHSLRNVRGVSMGDLNDDGFPDIVSASAQNWPAFAPLTPALPFPLGGPFDGSALLWLTFFPVDPLDLTAGFVWSGIDPLNGNLSVEINSADNGNGWIKVRTLGSKDITSHGSVNRDGIGAVIRFTAHAGGSAMAPVLGGSSFASQHSLEQSFGLGAESYGTLDVLWPGGVRNRLHYVGRGQRVLFPEIPCSIDSDRSVFGYSACVWKSLTELKNAGHLNKVQRFRFYASAMLAYKEEHR